MSLGPRLDLRQSQSLVMTPQLQQAIKLLALSNLEIETFIAEELEKNPLLEAERGPAGDGEDITGLPMYRRAILGLGYLPQETSIFRGLTVSQNIMAVLEVAEPDKAARQERLDQLLAEFHIERLRDSPAMALSGGERRRCEIARALAANPSIMLLDEPFAGIDPISISDIRDLIVQLKTRNIGVLITDHNVRETLDIVDRACIIYGGQVLFAGSPEDLVADENVRRLYLGESFEL